MEATVSCLLMLQKYISSKQKNSEIKVYVQCLGNVPKDFAINNMKKKNKKKPGLKGVVKFFSVDFNILTIF